MLRWCSPANHFGLSSRRLGFESRSEHFLYLKDIWESPSLSQQRGCPSGQRRQAQDLLTQVYQGSNPCSRIFFIFQFLFLLWYSFAGVGQAVILRDCGSCDSGSNLGPGPIFKLFLLFKLYLNYFLFHIFHFIHNFIHQFHSLILFINFIF